MVTFGARQEVELCHLSFLNKHDIYFHFLCIEYVRTYKKREMLDGAMRYFLGLVVTEKGSYEDNFLCSKFNIVVLLILSVQGMC